MIRIGIIDDQYELAEMLEETLIEYASITVQFLAFGGKDALKQLEKHHRNIDLLLVDISMPDMDGITTTHKIKEKYPHITVLMLTVLDTDDMIFKAILAGASGYILKGESVDKMVQLVEAAMEGQVSMSPFIAKKALNFIRTSYQEQSKKRAKPQDYGLTKREIQVLELISQALTYQQIAEQLFVSPKTVRNHMDNIYKKLQIHSKTEAINLIHDNQWFKKK